MSGTRTWLVFGREDEDDGDGCWWPLWKDETHRAVKPERLLERIRDRLDVGGETNYTQLAAVPVDDWFAPPVSSREAGTAE